LRDRIRQGRCHCLQHNLALAVDNADVRLFHRDIQSSKMFHGCSPFALGSQSYRTPEEQPPHYPMLQNSMVLWMKAGREFLAGLRTALPFGECELASAAPALCNAYAQQAAAKGGAWP